MTNILIPNDIDLTEEATEVIGGDIYVDRNGKKNINLGGEIDADPVFPVNINWGKIHGDIQDQTDLIAELDKKEDNDSTKISKFFEAHPEYDYQFLMSIAEKPVTSVTAYIQLIIDDKMETDALWIPYEIGKMCLVAETDATQLSKIISFYIPQTGQVGTVDLTDESGLVKFHLKTVIDVAEVSWGEIVGDISENSQLFQALANKLDINAYITVAEVDELFEG